MLFFVLLSLFALALGSNKFVTMRQNANRVGILDVVESNSGRIVAESDVTITFTWPYVQMTSDPRKKDIYVTSFPDNSSQAILYKFNSALQLEHFWPNTEYWFFDLQYSPAQQSLFGIKVTSTYGRTLSNFSMQADGDRVSATELFTLPYMWYVNASTFDIHTDRYFGLINYFPGKPESVLDQQLVVCDFHHGANCQVVPVSNSAGILHFISFSCKVSSLFFASMEGNTLHVGELDANTGKVIRLLHSDTAAEVGPLVAHDEEGHLSVFVKRQAGGLWELWQVPLSGKDVHQVHSFEPSTSFMLFDAVAKF